MYKIIYFNFLIDVTNFVSNHQELIDTTYHTLYLPWYREEFHILSGRVWEGGGGYPPPTVGTFSKIRVYYIKVAFLEHLKHFSREVNIVKIHFEKLS